MQRKFVFKRADNVTTSTTSSSSPAVYNNNHNSIKSTTTTTTATSFTIAKKPIFSNNESPLPSIKPNNPNNNSSSNIPFSIQNRREAVSSASVVKSLPFNSPSSNQKWTNQPGNLKSKTTNQPTSSSDFKYIPVNTSAKKQDKERKINDFFKQKNDEYIPPIIEDETDQDWKNFGKVQNKYKSPVKPVSTESPPSDYKVFQKPVATVTPQIKEVTSKNELKSVQNEKFIIIDSPTPVCKTNKIIVTEDSPIKPQKIIAETTEEIKKYISDYQTNRCYSCNVEYDNKSRNNRQIIDSCNHLRCFKCLINENMPCAICEKLNDLSSSSFKHSVNNKTKEITVCDTPVKKLDSSDSEEITYSPVVVQPKSKSDSTSSLKKDTEEFIDLDIDLEPDIRPLNFRGSNKNTKLADQGSKSSAFNSKKINQFDDIVVIDDDLFDDDVGYKKKPKGKISNKSDLYDDEEDESDIDDYLKSQIEEIDLVHSSNPKSKASSLSSRALNEPKSVFLSPAPVAASASSSSSSIVVSTKLFGKHADIHIPDIKNYEKIRWLFNDIQDCSALYRDVNYPHSDSLLTAFRNLFGLKQFRPQQFEAVNASLLGNNCFILMPTGGGKSLCYQLPAVVSKGVTFVVSPLKSLILDQVQKLNALNIPAAHLLSEGNNPNDSIAGGSSACEYIYQDLCRQEPTLKLIYVTPEKLNCSGKLTSILTGLYNRGMISRLVIDEAHCVSTWGHDFRKDYTQMGALRNRLIPNVPVMLLTATATPRVRKDILIQMSLSCDQNPSNSGPSFPNSALNNKLNNRHYMTSSNGYNKQSQKCAFFIQSFNRENLQYAVEYKTSNAAALEKIANIIRTKYPNKSGIVYCISRNECESVSEFLRKQNIKAMAYHAGMTDKQRATIQTKWSTNHDCKVVCATIAFGMGIDKADVRYVIHLGLPKSLEGYYQESGRAGRDGQVSYCLLFYNNQDRHKWIRLMKQEQQNSGGGNNYEVFRVHMDNLYRMAQYCDNRTDCRRAQILEYFGEIFDRSKCINSKMQTACDNCTALATNNFRLEDITSEAQSICKGVQRLCNEDFTLVHLSEILKGSMNSKITEKQHNKLEMHAKLSRYTKTDIERLVRKLIFNGILKEDIKILPHTETCVSYIKLGPKSADLLSGRIPKVEFELTNEGGYKQQVIKKITTLEDVSDSDSDDESSSEQDANSTISKQNKKEMAEKKRQKKNEKLSELTAENRILYRCKTDVVRKFKEICAQKGAKNSNIFTNKMITEMVTQLPTNKEELISVTHFTEALYNKFEGEKILEITCHYAKLIKELRDEEEKKKQDQAVLAFKNKMASTLGQSSSYSTNKNDKTYGLIEPSNNAPTFEFSGCYDDSWMGKSNNNNNKRKTNNFSGFKNKKRKTNNYENENEDESGGNTSSYFNKAKKNNFYKKKSNFKFYKKK